MNRRTALGAVVLAATLAVAGCAPSLDSIQEQAAAEVWTFEELSENERLEWAGKIDQAPSEEAVNDLLEGARSKNEERQQHRKEQEETWAAESQAAQEAFAELEPLLDNKVWRAEAGDVTGAGDDEFELCELQFSLDGTVQELSEPGKSGCSLRLGSERFEEWEFDESTHELVLIRRNGESRFPFVVEVSEDGRTVTLEQRGIAEHTKTFTVEDA